MRISAISGVYSYSNDNIYSPNNKCNDVCHSIKKAEEPKTDIQFNSLSASDKEKSLSQIYDNINEWKYFCHKQILKGKLDIIV